MTEEQSSYFCKRNILRVAALVLLAIIAVMLFEVSLVTEGYEPAIDKLIAQER
jgi:hypothetical protein